MGRTCAFNDCRRYCPAALMPRAIDTSTCHLGFRLIVRPGQVSPERRDPVAEFLTTLANVFTLAFVITSMLSVGLSLTIPQIVAPLKNARLVVLALVVNFVVVPAVAFALAKIIPMEKDLQIGLILYGTAAGAPFLPKLAQIAKANLAFAVGLMVLLMVVTVVYLPIVLPLLLPGVSVDALSIAGTLAWAMLLPLGVGLFIKARYVESADALQPHMAQISSVSLVLVLVLMLATNIKSVLRLFGTGALVATLITLAVACAAGYLLGGPGVENQRVMALGSGQRNIAAAMVVATGNFASQTNVLVFVAAAALVGMIVIMPLAGEFGKRSAAAAQQAATPEVAPAPASEAAP
jgi:BASS family bile acid:Na+ symporter